VLDDPLGHATHVAVALAPVATEYLPDEYTRHSAAVVAPEEAEYVPTGQPRQLGEPRQLVPKYSPGLHAQAAPAVVPAGEVEPPWNDENVSPDVL